MLIQLLEILGHKAESATPTKVKFKSPFRDERTPSFFVFRNENTGEFTNWKDYGNGLGGDTYKFLMLYFNIGFVEAKKKLEELTGYTRSTATYEHSNFYLNQPTPTKKQEPTYKIVKTQPLQNRALIQYLNQRGINDDTLNLPQVKEYLEDVYYEMKDKRFFGIGFKNNSDGYEIRNQYFKASFGTKDITIISPSPFGSQIKIFEGFIDYLSYLEIAKGKIQRDISDYIILNSLSMLEKVLELIQGKYELIELYLDNDKAGNEATVKIMATLSSSRIIDKRRFYQSYKDVNEYLLSR